MEINGLYLGCSITAFMFGYNALTTQVKQRNKWSGFITFIIFTSLGSILMRFAFGGA